MGFRLSRSGGVWGKVGRAWAWAGLIGLLAATPGAAAAIITFEHAASASGTLDGKPFPMADFTITATGDTANRQPISDGWYIDHTAASIFIAGIGKLDLLTPTRTFVSHAGQLVGFSRAGADGNDLVNGPQDAAFGTWDMLTSIGPIKGQGGVLQWSLDPKIDTSGGILILDDGVTNVTFTAIVPEPGTAGLVAAGLMMLRRRRG